MKAFDCNKHDILIERLKGANLYDKELRIIKILYWNQKATIRVQNIRPIELIFAGGSTGLPSIAAF